MLEEELDLGEGGVRVAESEQTSLKACCKTVVWVFFQTSLSSRTFHNLKRMETGNPVADES